MMNLFQMLFFKTDDRIVFSIFSGVFTTLAKAYDFLINTIDNYNEYGNLPIDNVAKIMYVLAGIFILFRVTVSLIEMLINPDLTTDSQAGVGKIFTRLVVSLLLLVICVPDGLLFGSNGILQQLEEAIVVGDESLVNKLSTLNGGLSDDGSVDNSSSTSDAPNPITKPSSNGSPEGGSHNFKSYSNFFIENAYAKSPLVCYYYDVNITRNYTARNAPNGIEINDFYKITFVDEKTSGYTKLEDSYYNSESGEIYYKFDTSIVDAERFGPDFKYKDIESGKKLQYNHFVRWQDNIFYKKNNELSRYKEIVPDDCPTSIATDGYGEGGYYWIIDRPSLTGLVGGYEDLDEMIEDIGIIYAEDNVTTPTDNPAVEAHEPGHRKRTEGIKFAVEVSKTFMECLDYPDKEYADIETMQFDNALAKCESMSSKTCACKQLTMFDSSGDANEIVNALDKGDLDLDFITSVIIGIAFTIFVLYLCVEVIIRRFKLLLLQIIAPIPIVAYVDPKSKLLNEWVSMYAATYVGLFIKLIALKLAIILIKSVSLYAPAGLFSRLLYLVAVLLFAKLIPSLISKVTGLNDLGGSFKEIAGLAKKGIGLAKNTGTAVAGLGAAGLTTASQLFGKKDLSKREKAWAMAKNMAVGAGAGWKGNIKGGINAAARDSSKRLEQRADNLSWFDSMKAGFYDYTQLTPPGKKATEEIKAAAEIQAKAKAYKDYGEEKAIEKGIQFQTASGLKGKYLKNQDVFQAGETVDAKREVEIAQALSAVSAEEWVNMDQQVKEQTFGTTLAGISSIVDAKLFQNDRVVVAREEGGAEFIRQNANKSEVLKLAADLNDAIEAAQTMNPEVFAEGKDDDGNVKRFIKANPATVTAGELSDRKSMSINKQLEIAEAHKKDITVSKYIGGN